MTSVAAVARRAKVVARANAAAVAMDVAVTAADADEIMNVVHMRTTSTLLTLTGSLPRMSGSDLVQ